MKRIASLAIFGLMAIMAITTPAAAANPKHALYGLETALERIFGGPDLCFSLKDGITFQAYQHLLHNEQVPRDVVRACRKHVVYPSLSTPGDGGSCPPFPEGLTAENAILIWGDDNTVGVVQHGENLSYNLVDGNGNTVVVNQDPSGNISVLELHGTNINVSLYQGGGGNNKFYGVFVGDNLTYDGSQSGGESCSVTVQSSL